MKALFHSKNTIVLLIILIIMPVYISLLSFDPFGFNGNPIDIIVYLLCALFIIYFIYLLTTILEYIMLKMTKIVEVNFVVIFPFTYDGNFRFTPIKSLSSQVNLQASAVINLVNDIKKDVSDEIIIKKLKKLLFLRITVIVFAYFMMFLFIGYTFHTLILIPFFISCFFEIIILFTSDNKYWRGIGSLLINGDIEQYLYTLPNIKGFTADDYAGYLDRTIDHMKENNQDKYIRMLENTIFASIYEEKQPWHIEQLKWYCDTILATSYEIKWSAIAQESKKISLKKCLGLLGLLTKDDEIKQLSIDFLRRHISLIQHDSVYAANHEQRFLDFLTGAEVAIKPTKHLSIGIIDFFAHRSRVEQKIKELVYSNSTSA